ncbi:MAG: hypothetical protein K2P19_09765 [Kineothrix sp.]|nr:hypothetical protein [Kineothrix sp.]
MKKRIPTTKEQQAIFRNTHETIVEDAVFERVQKVDIVFHFVGEINFLSATQPKRQGA